MGASNGHWVKAPFGHTAAQTSETHSMSAGKGVDGSVVDFARFYATAKKTAQSGSFSASAVVESDDAHTGIIGSFDEIGRRRTRTSTSTRITGKTASPISFSKPQMQNKSTTTRTSSVFAPDSDSG